MSNINWEEEISIPNLQSIKNFDGLVNRLFKSEKHSYRNDIYETREFIDYLEDILITHLIKSNCNCGTDDHGKSQHPEKYGKYLDEKYVIPVNCPKKIEKKPKTCTVSEIIEFKLIDPEIFLNAQKYHIKVLKQINDCYNIEAYDACFVMIRRLIETLIIDIYGKLRKLSSIKDENDVFYRLQKLVNTITDDDEVNLSQNTKKLLRNAKFFGDSGAHNRKSFVTKSNIDENRNQLGMSFQELLVIIGKD